MGAHRSTANRRKRIRRRERNERTREKAALAREAPSKAKTTKKRQPASK
jgi:hypothetical protein